jgi:hypothetical protein
MVVFKVLPIDRAPAMIAIERNNAIMQYSIALAPRSSATNLLSIRSPLAALSSAGVDNPLS